MVNVSQLRENFEVKEEESFIQMVVVITGSLFKSYN